jgi:hypothetical protein
VGADVPAPDTTSGRQGRARITARECVDSRS